MGEELIIQGDAESAVISMLTGSSELMGFPGGSPTVSSDLQGYQAGMRWMTVQRQGGSLFWPRIDKPRIDVNVFAETRTVAHDLAQVAQAVCLREMGQPFPSANVFVSDVRIETGLIRVPDPPTGSHRYLFSLRLTCVPI